MICDSRFGFILSLSLFLLDRRPVQRGVTDAIGGFFDEKRGLGP
jgi:hypothetical protein